MEASFKVPKACNQVRGIDNGLYTLAGTSCHQQTQVSYARQLEVWHARFSAGPDPAYDCLCPSPSILGQTGITTSPAPTSPAGTECEGVAMSSGTSGDIHQGRGSN